MMTLCTSDMRIQNKTKTILLVDNEPENIPYYADVLVNLGYNVIARPDADSALQLFHDGAKIDLIITEDIIRGETGFEFVLLLSRLRPSVPVIMITAHGNIQTYLRSRSLGVIEYVHKPIRKKELERIVEHALQRSTETEHTERMWNEFSFARE